MSARCLALMALTTLCAGRAMAQAPEEGDAITSQSVPALGSLFDVGDAPAFDALGKASSDISSPNSGREVVASLLNGLDQNGNFNTGIGLQFSPYLLANKRDLSIEQYQSNQALARFNLTLATARAVENDKGLLASVGFNWMPIAQDDPFADDALVSCLTNWVRTADDVDADVQSGLQAPAKPVRKSLRQCRDDYANKGKFSLQIGFAGVFFSPTGETTDMRGQGIFANAVLRYELPASDTSLLAMVAYRNNEAVPDPDTDGSFLERDRFSAGGRLMVGVLSGVALGAEAVYQKADYASLGQDDYVTYTASASFKISDDFWLNFKAGGSSGRRIDGNPAFFGTSLNWGQAPTLKIGN